MGLTHLTTQLTTHAEKIYLAGFDVFRLDAHEYGEQLKAKCRARNLIGLWPADGEVPGSMNKHEAAHWIYHNNRIKIQQCDAVMVNINDFRGDVDAGSAWEIGFANALNKPIFGYRESLNDLISQTPGEKRGAVHVDRQGYVVEDFNLPVNLMIACSIEIVQGGPDACLDAIANFFKWSIEDDEQ